MYENHHRVAGFLGADPLLRRTGGGRSVVHLRIATKYKYTPKESREKKEITTWHSVVCYGFWADIASTWSKGDFIDVEGPVFDRKIVPTDGSRPRIVRELRVSSAHRHDRLTGYKVDPPAVLENSIEEEADQKLGEDDDDDWPV